MNRAVWQVVYLVVGTVENLAALSLAAWLFDAVRFSSFATIVAVACAIQTVGLLLVFVFRLALRRSFRSCATVGLASLVSPVATVWVASAALAGFALDGFGAYVAVIVALVAVETVAEPIRKRLTRPLETRFPVEADLTTFVPSDTKDVLDAYETKNEAALVASLAEGRSRAARTMAAQYVDELGITSAIPALCDMATDVDPKLRAYATHRLTGLTRHADGEMRPTAVTTLRTALRDGDRVVRMTAASGLAQANAGEAIPDLRVLLADNDAWCRLYAAESLAELGDVSAIAMIEEAIEREGRFSRRRGRLRASMERLRAGSDAPT